MIERIKAAQKAGDSLGGVVEVLAYGVPIGLGSHVHWDRKLDALLAQALMSIQAVKGVEIGDGFDVAGRPGSEAHDAIVWDDDASTYRRLSTNAGGIEGGMSTGEVLVAHVAMKPLATLNRPVLATVNTATKDATVSFKERTDVTAVPAMGVVAEAMAALVLADEALRKFGGDSLTELVRNHATYAGPGPRADVPHRHHGRRRRRRRAGQLGRSPGLRGRRAGPGLRRARGREPVRAPPSGARRARRDDGGGQDLRGSPGGGRPRPTLLRQRRRRSRPAPAAPFAEIFEADGEAAFRELETSVLADALASVEPRVIAAAGGVVLAPGNRRLLRSAGTVVWLQAPVGGARRPRRHRPPSSRGGGRSGGRAHPHGGRRGPSSTPRSPMWSSTARCP